MSVTLSIVVPAYNVKSYVQPCIESIMASTFRDFEVLLVDDGSTDGTGALCDELAAKYPEIRVFHTENQGLSMARNLGMNHANGTYIGFVDSDDIIAPRMYEALLSHMEPDVQMACCRFCRCLRENVSPLEYTGAYQICGNQGAMEQVWVNFYGAYVTTKVFRRELLEENAIRFKPGYLNEDVYFMADLFPFVQKSVFLGDALYYYIDTPGSIVNASCGRTHVGKAYISRPRSWVYTEKATARYPKVHRINKARATMTYQMLLRKLDPEDPEFTKEAIAYVRRNKGALLRYTWGIPYYASGCLLCISYPLWKKIFRY